MTRIFIDTSGWYALLNRADPNHADVAKVFAEPGHRWFTSNFVIDETLTLFLARLGHPAAVKAGRLIRAGASAEILRVEPSDEDLAWGIFERQDGPSFTDCTSFVIMRRNRIDTALTLDGDFRRQGLHCLPG